MKRNYVGSTYPNHNSNSDYRNPNYVLLDRYLEPLGKPKPEFGTEVPMHVAINLRRRQSLAAGTHVAIQYTFWP